MITGNLDLSNEQGLMMLNTIIDDCFHNQCISLQRCYPVFRLDDQRIPSGKKQTKNKSISWYKLGGQSWTQPDGSVSLIPPKLSQKLPGDHFGLFAAVVEVNFMAMKQEGKMNCSLFLYISASFPDSKRPDCLTTSSQDTCRRCGG